MGIYQIKETTLNALADASREKNLTDKDYTLDEVIKELPDIHYENHKVNFIPYCMYYGNKNLKSAYVDNKKGNNAISNYITTINSHAFNGTGLKKAIFPNVQTLEDCAFYECYDLETTDFTNLVTINNTVFFNCTSLKEIQLDHVSVINLKVFHRCFGLEKIILPSNTICKLNSVGAFDCTPFYGVDTVEYTDPQTKVKETRKYSGIMFGKDGNIYVPGSLSDVAFFKAHASSAPGFSERVLAMPQSLPETIKPCIYVNDNLVNSYKSASNWSMLTAEFKPISELNK